MFQLARRKSADVLFRSRNIVRQLYSVSSSGSSISQSARSLEENGESNDVLRGKRSSKFKPLQKDSGAYDSVRASSSDRIYRVIIREGWTDETLRKLRRFHGNISEESVLQVLENLAETPEFARKFFDWAASFNRSNLGAAAFNALIRIVGTPRRTPDFWEMAEEMRNRGFKMEMKTYVTVSRRFSKKKMNEDHMRLFLWMIENGEEKPSARDCYMLLKRLSDENSPDIGSAMKVVEGFKKSGGIIKKAIYDGIHRCLTSSGRFEKAAEILDSMKKDGFVPDNITYSQLIFGLCKHKRLDEACSIIEEMEKQNCIPDIETWAVLIEGHCSAGEVDKALHIFKKVSEECSDVDSEILGILVKQLCSRNRESEAYDFFSEMVEKRGLKPPEATYEALITKLIVSEKLQEASIVLRLMKAQGYRPFLHVFYKFFAQKKSVYEANDFLVSLRNFVSPTKAYVAMVAEFFYAHRQKEAHALVSKCPNQIVRNHKLRSMLFYR
eukprot:TRINITY_DN11515_c0_g1_i1.p1 TRINITY_DN11515_c0_g1~~TRINITY_DN11515_c0_g1_i1.p1  ORF type:complete len:497 (+),score=63.76 TRINITY_DN11515_c0_g1_i1:52-1542(+)